MTRVSEDGKASRESFSGRAWEPRRVQVLQLSGPAADSSAPRGSTAPAPGRQPAPQRPSGNRLWASFPQARATGPCPGGRVPRAQPEPRLTARWRLASRGQRALRRGLGLTPGAWTSLRPHPGQRCARSRHQAAGGRAT